MNVIWKINVSTNQVKILSVYDWINRDWICFVAPTGSTSLTISHSSFGKYTSTECYLWSKRINHKIKINFFQTETFYSSLFISNFPSNLVCAFKSDQYLLPISFGPGRTYRYLQDGPAKDYVDLVSFTQEWSSVLFRQKKNTNYIES